MVIIGRLQPPLFNQTGTVAECCIKNNIFQRNIHHFQTLVYNKDEKRKYHTVCQ
jgi:hypothetical protein